VFFHKKASFSCKNVILTVILGVSIFHGLFGSKLSIIQGKEQEQIKLLEKNIAEEKDHLSKVLCTLKEQKNQITFINNELAIKILEIKIAKEKAALFNLFQALKERQYDVAFLNNELKHFAQNYSISKPAFKNNIQPKEIQKKQEIVKSVTIKQKIDAAKIDEKIKPVTYTLGLDAHQKSNLIFKYLDNPSDILAKIGALSFEYGYYLVHSRRYPDEKYEICDKDIIQENIACWKLMTKFGVENLKECSAKQCVFRRNPCGTGYSLDPGYEFPAFRRLVEDEIVRFVTKHYKKEDTISYLSFASGLLFQDFIILNKLIVKGYKNFKISLVDSLYNTDIEWSEERSNAIKAQEAFSSWFSGMGNILVTFFSSSDDYLKMLKDKKNSEADVMVFIDAGSLSSWSKSDNPENKITDELKWIDDCSLDLIKNALTAKGQYFWLGQNFADSGTYGDLVIGNSVSVLKKYIFEFKRNPKARDESKQDTWQRVKPNFEFYA